MTGEAANPNPPSASARPKRDVAPGAYDPFARGPFPVGVRTLEVQDATRGRLFPCEIWYPATVENAGRDLAPETQDAFAVPPDNKARRQPAVRDAAAQAAAEPRAGSRAVAVAGAEPQAGGWPLILFSHSSGGGRRQSTFLCTHLSSHGYVVAALDHSEIVARELARVDGETEEQKAARQKAWIASRVPDIRLLLDHMLQDRSGIDPRLDPTRVGIVGHSFGGWTALATPDVEERIGAVVALAPAGSSQPKPGILAAELAFDWGRDVPTLYLVAENDVSMPLSGMHELLGRTPAGRQMVILRRADHMHFMDDVEQLHEAVRAMPFTGELAWVPKEMRPIAELCSEEEAHLFVRGLTLGHLDAVLGQQAAAREFLLGDLEAELARRGVDGVVAGRE